MDSRICQTSTASPAEPGGLSFWARDESLRRFGDNWIRSGQSAALLVPSAAIRGEWNLLLNPAHSGFLKVRYRDPEPFEFDTRMFR